MAKNTEGAASADFNMFHMENAEDRTMRLFGKNPYLLFGLGGGVGGLAYMAKKFSQKGNMKPSVYLIHTRLLVQITIVGSISAGMVYGLYKKNSQYYKDSYNSTRARISAAEERRHTINWPKGGYESKPSKGITITEFRKNAPSSKELEEATYGKQ